MMGYIKVKRGGASLVVCKESRLLTSSSHQGRLCLIVCVIRDSPEGLKYDKVVLEMVRFGITARVAFYNHAY